MRTTAYGDVRAAFREYLQQGQRGPRLRARRPLPGDLHAAPPRRGRGRPQGRRPQAPGLRAPARRERHGQEGLGPRRRLPARPRLPLEHPARLRRRVLDVQRDAAEPLALRPPVPRPRRRAGGHLGPRGPVHEPGGARRRLGRGSPRSSPRRPSRPGRRSAALTGAVGFPMPKVAHGVRPGRRRLRRALLGRERRARPAPERRGAARRAARRRAGACTSRTRTSRSGNLVALVGKQVAAYATRER